MKLQQRIINAAQARHEGWPLEANWPAPEETVYVYEAQIAPGVIIPAGRSVGEEAGYSSLVEFEQELEAFEERLGHNLAIILDMY